MHFIYFLKTDITEIDIALSINHAHSKLSLLKLTSFFLSIMLIKN